MQFRTLKLWRPLPVVSIYLTLFSIILVLFPSLNQFFEWDKEKIFISGIYRVFTCHFTHFGFNHFFWDTLIFFLLAIIIENNDRRLFINFLIFHSLLIAFVNYVTIDLAYRGLSGTDSGLYGIMLLNIFYKQKKLQKYILLLLVLFFCKIFYEVCSQKTLFVVQSHELFIPAYQAHLAGFLSGVFVFLFSKHNKIICPNSLLRNFLNKHRNSTSGN